MASNRWRFKTFAASRMVAQLNREGRRIMYECMNEITYTHRTKNLYDSYGYGVYYEGKIAAYGFMSAPRAHGKRKIGGRMVSGREEIKNYLFSFNPHTNSFFLVVAAAMPYATALENHHYRVISMATDKLRALSREIKGSNVGLYKGSL